jgi:hypothetical protein
MKKLIIGLSFILTLTVAAQEIGLNASNSWTDNQSVGTIPGFGVSIFQSLGKVGVRFDFTHSENSETYEGMLVRGLMVPPSPIATEIIKSSINLQSYELFVAFNDLTGYGNFALNIALGGSIDNFSTSRYGTASRLTADISETKYGWQYLISLSYNKLFNLPLKPYIQFKHKFMYGTQYVTDFENIFEGDVESRQLQVGIYYIFNM